MPADRPWWRQLWVRRALIIARWHICGRDFAARQREEAVAERRVNTLAASLASQSEPVTEEQLEDFQARSLVLNLARTRRRYSRPIWRFPERIVIALVLLVTAIGLIGISVPASSIRVELDAQVDQLLAILEPVESGAPIQIGLQQFRCRSITLSGVDLPHTGGGDPRLQTLTLSVREEAGTPLNQFLAVREVLIPRGVTLSLEAGTEWLVLRMTPPAPGKRGDAPLSYRVVLSIPQGAAGLVRTDGVPTEFPLAPSPLGPEQRIIAGDIQNQPVELRLSIDQAATSPMVSLGFQGVDLADLALGDYRDSADQRPRSYILGGMLRFPGRELDPIVLRKGEALSLSDRRGFASSGQLLELQYINRAGTADGGETKFIEQHLQLLWDGRVHAITQGIEGRKQSRMPKLIFAWLGSKQQLYLIGIIVYAGIFAYSLVMKSQPGATDSMLPTELMS